MLNGVMNRKHGNIMDSKSPVTEKDKEILSEKTIDYIREIVYFAYSKDVNYFDLKRIKTMVLEELETHEFHEFEKFFSYMMNA